MAIIDCALGDCGGQIPCLNDSGTIPPPVKEYSIYVYSNDGNELLGTILFYNASNPQSQYIYPYEYVHDIDSSTGEECDGIFSYPGGGHSYPILWFNASGYKGLSYSPNQSIGEIELGTILAITASRYQGINTPPVPEHDVTVYVVESGGGSSTLSVTYNSTKIIDSEEVTPPIDVTYNGSTIVTLNAGDTTVLDILGEDNKPKILSTPIVIGGKTIPNVDALGRKWVLEHNLEIEVGGE